MTVLRKGMAFSSKFLHPFRHSFTLISPPTLSFSHPKPFNYGNFDFVKSFLKSLEPSVRARASIFKSDVNISRKYIRNIYVCAQDALVDDPYEDSLNPSEEEEHQHHLWRFARKFWLPVFFFLTVFANSDDPILLLLIKVTLFLLSTKPNPYSVYIFVDELCQQGMREERSLHKLKSLYASKVEVQDYTLLCLANIEVKNQNFTLVGVLGNWWTLPHIIIPQEAFTLIRDRLESILVKAT